MFPISASSWVTPTRSKAPGTLLRWPLLVGLAAVLVNGRAAGNGFALDDVRLIASNPSIASVLHIPKLFFEPYWNAPGENHGLYRPLTIVSFALDRALFGAGPLGFHLVNVALHAAVSVLAWFVLRRVGTHFGTALAGACLFAVLPIHTEAVANIAGRAELLAALFVLSAWLARERPYLSALFYLAAMLSKESAILAPLVFFADDALARRKARPLHGFAIALAVMLALRVLALGAHQTSEGVVPLDNPAAAAGMGPRVATALWVQVKYAWICVAPVHLVSDYSFDAIPVVRAPSDPRLIAGLAFAIGLAAASVWGWKRSRPIAVATIVWVAFALPASNLLFPTGTIMAERLAYLPSLAVCLAIGHVVATPFASRVARVLSAALACGLFVAYSARTLARIPDWKDNFSLAMADVAVHPRSAKLQAGAGMFLADAGRTAEAEDRLRRALAIYPDYAQMHYNLGVLLARRGARDEAVFHLERAIALAPANPLPRRLLDQLQHGD